MDPRRIPYKYIAFPIMFYMTIEIAAAILVGKQVIISHNIISAASVPILPLAFFCSDIVSEVYGYRVARQMIWIGMFCELIFALLCAELIKLPSPHFLHYGMAYQHVLGTLPKIFLAGCVGRVSGLFLNVYIISKLKVLVKGKYFWLRSLGSTSIGELVFTIASVLIIFAGKVPSSHLLSIMVTAYIYKLVFSPIAVFPAAVCVNFLKKHEGIDVYDNAVDFNPFKLALN